MTNFKPMDDADLEGYAGCEFKIGRPLMAEFHDGDYLWHLVIDDVNLQARAYDAEAVYVKAWALSGKRPATLAIGDALIAGGKFDDATFEAYGFECCHDIGDVCAPTFNAEGGLS